MNFSSVAKGRFNSTLRNATKTFAEQQQVSKVFKDLQTNPNLIKGEVFDLPGGIKVKYGGIDPATQTNYITDLADKPIGLVNDLIADLKIDIEVKPGGLTTVKQLEPDRLNQFEAEFKSNGMTDSQAKVAVDTLKDQINNSPLGKQIDNVIQVEKAQSQRYANNAPGSKVEADISAKKQEIDKVLYEAANDAKNAVEVPGNPNIKGAQDVLAKATGKNAPGEVMNKLQRQGASEKLVTPEQVVNSLASEANSSTTLSTKVKSRFKTLGKIVLGLGVVGVLANVGNIIAACTESTLATAAEEHQKDLNGCWLIDSIALTETKLKLLTCGHYDVASALETCSTQVYNAANAATITECPTTTFNPCVKTSKSRATDRSVPLVPNVCDTYLYNGTAPAAVSGVTVKNACLREDGTPLKTTEACSVYCNTANFNLPSHQTLLCRSVDFPTAFAHLMSNLGVDPTTIFPPPTQGQTAQEQPITAVSKPLVIAAAVLGGVFLILLFVHILR